MSDPRDVTIGSVTQIGSFYSDLQKVVARASQPSASDVEAALRVLGDPHEGVQVRVLDEMQLMSMSLPR